MNPQLRQIEHWMAAQHRIARWSPVSKLPPFERVDCVEYIARSLRTLGFALKAEVNFSAITSDEEHSTINPAEVLAALAVLHANVLAAYHATGLAAAASPALYELTMKHLPPSAATNLHDPNFEKLLKDVYDFQPPVAKK